jgi:hypothetical protein
MSPCGTKRTSRLLCLMSAIGWTTENICSARVFPGLTHYGSRRSWLVIVLELDGARSEHVHRLRRKYGSARGWLVPILDFQSANR